MLAAMNGWDITYQPSIHLRTASTTKRRYSRNASNRIVSVQNALDMNSVLVKTISGRKNVVLDSKTQAIVGTPFGIAPIGTAFRTFVPTASPKSRRKRQRMRQNGGRSLASDLVVPMW
ncbi:hypothetical protein C5B42_05665 [Candidatus Cerribacteria bacterium 'Amazon FNV 2010 28 9']|uniref:Uncharacterized protein n=1 Tax=Candidatus Cerribacteria bacterium 'Amazon FNV 2010 28 9' TaxID=2081795 RepID=A0A317JR72_9BACT|nr:MAG: hypothetical protein C5B42_05665 [Candidatus Cerribacteria bacterium 'Amazon FNV 2010 28 9']